MGSGSWEQRNVTSDRTWGGVNPPDSGVETIILLPLALGFHSPVLFVFLIGDFKMECLCLHFAKKINFKRHTLLPITIILFFKIYLFIGRTMRACGILAPGPGIEPGPPAM